MTVLYQLMMPKPMSLVSMPLIKLFVDPPVLLLLWQLVSLSGPVDLLRYLVAVLLSGSVSLLRYHVK